jgi:hypothetical protein
MTTQPPDIVATLQAAHLQHYDLADKIADAHRRLHAALRDDADRAQRWRAVAAIDGELADLWQEVADTTAGAGAGAAAQAEWYRRQVTACLTHASDHDTTPVDADTAVTA